MARPLRVLIVEDSEADAALLEYYLRLGGLDTATRRVETPAALRAALEEEEWDVVISDYSLPGFDGVSALRLVQSHGDDVPFILVSGAIGAELAVAAMKAGAHDYVLKDHLWRLVPAVEREVQEAESRRQRRLAEEALRDSEAQLCLALEASDMGWWQWDFATGVLDGDAKTRGLVGLPVDEPIGSFQRVLERTNSEDWDRLQERAAELQARAGDYEVEFRVTWPDGSVRWVFAKGRSFPTGGKPRRAMGIAMDVTTRKQADEQLQRLAQFPEENPNPVLRVSREGKLLYSNRAAGDQLAAMGWSSDEPLPEKLQAMVRHAWQASTVTQIEQEMECARGRIFLCTVTPVRDAGYINLYGRDVTERKQAEEQLAAAKVSAERAKAAAEEANRAKDHFLAVLSHELRTPLTPVVMAVSMLHGRPDLDQAMRDTLEMVHRNVELEARLIDDLLDVTRIARGKIELHKQRVELYTVLQRAVEVCMPDIEARGLHLGMDVGPDAPCWIEADGARLQQVFWNLLKNAVKFTPQGGQVGIRCRPNEKDVVVEISDSGIGIEPEVAAHIFNAFEQGERSVTRQFGGLGLGLAISKALVEMHGGQIEVSSAGRNKGAMFRVRLPQAAPARKPAAPAEVPRPAVYPLHILLVEDHGATAKMLKIVLSTAGYTVETAGDMATALDLAASQRFDLLLSDLGLPDGSGHELMCELRRRGHNFPGIALSGYGQEEDIERSHEAGFAAHLAKPSSLEVILETVAAVGPTAVAEQIAG